MIKNYFFLLLLLISISINSQVVNIPDANFKTVLLNYNPVIDTNGDGEIQKTEAEAVTGAISVDYRNISSLTGIEAFININGLSFNNNNVSEVDLSRNTKISNLTCARNNLTSLDISNNPEIYWLVCFDNEINDIELSKNTKLETLNISQNNLNSIDVSMNLVLRSLDISFNDNISTLVLENNVNLEFLSLMNCNVSNLDISNNPLIKRLNCAQTNILSMNLGIHTDLEKLNISNTSISNLNINNNIRLNDIEAQQMRLLENISFVNNLDLEKVTITGDRISEFDFSNNPNLKELYLKGGEDLTTINIANGNNVAITKFSLSSVNSNVSCVKVDTGFSVPGTWDQTVSYNDSCVQFKLNLTRENGVIAINPYRNSLVYEENMQVTLIPVANEGYEFVRWLGDASGSGIPIGFTMNADKNITAVFSKIRKDPTIETFSSGYTSLEGVAVNANNEVYVSEHNSGKIFKLDNDGNSVLQATSSFRANGLAFDTSDKLYVAAPFSGKILVANNSGVLTEYINASGDSPYGIAFNNGVLYYVAENGGKVVKVSGGNVKEDFVTGFFTAEDIAFDSNGNAYVSDRNDRKLFKVTPEGVKSEVASGYAAIRGVAIANDKVYFTTYTFNTNKIIKYNPEDGSLEEYVTTMLNEPRDIAIDKLGNMYVTNKGDNTVIRIYDENLKPSGSLSNNSYNDLSNRILIAPNPVKNILTVKNLQNEIIKNIEVFNILGGKVKESNTNSLNVASLPKGIYILQIETESTKTAVKKFIKE